jgi:hypothetical protein
LSVAVREIRNLTQSSSTTAAAQPADLARRTD